jgi:hypothetical protein
VTPPDFSEFSYGYAVTEELVASLKAAIVGAPSFPSLYQEGKKGGGYDMKLPLVGRALLLQFKVSDYLKKKSAREYRNGLIKNVPYYRMHLRPLRHSDQHNLLLDWEASGEIVFYIAPEFHLPHELNDFYLRKVVVQNSAAFKPSDIGALPDDEPHYVAFERGSPIAFRCSDNPKEIRKNLLHDFLFPSLQAANVQTRLFGPDGLREIANRMVSILSHAEERSKARHKPIDIEGVRRIVADRNPAEAVGYVTRTFFDAELLILPS